MGLRAVLKRLFGGKAKPADPAPPDLDSAIRADDVIRRMSEIDYDVYDRSVIAADRSGRSD